jgi:hypothetical protein
MYLSLIFRSWQGHGGPMWWDTWPQGTQKKDRSGETPLAVFKMLHARREAEDPDRQKIIDLLGGVH